MVVVMHLVVAVVMPSGNLQAYLYGSPDGKGVPPIPRTHNCSPTHTSAGSTTQVGFVFTIRSAEHGSPTQLFASVTVAV